MQTALSMHQVPFSAAERQHLDGLNQRMSRYFRRILSVSWDIRKSAGDYAIRCSVHAQSGDYCARAAADSIGFGLDAVFDKIVRQRRRAHVTAMQTRQRRGAVAKVMARTG